MISHGPYIENGQVHFSLWAPDVDAIFLEIAGGPTVLLRKEDQGWKRAVVQGGAGLRYRFRIGDTRFPDPASRRQDGGVHGWSVVTICGTGSSWRGRPWAETVLYECHVGLMGGFAGVEKRLPALADMGITAIELMPIAAFPGERNWGYDGVLPYAVAEAYGTPEELRRLIASAHALELNVFLDVVYNHFGPDGNYLPLYARPFFRNDCPTPWGPAIDFSVPQVRQFFADNARQWLFDYGFDGLRFDAVHAIVEQEWLNDLAMILKKEAGERHIHLVLENENNDAEHLRRGFDAQWNDDLHHALHVLLTGETNGYYQDFAAEPARLLAKALAEGFIYQGQPSANRSGGPRGEPSGDLGPTAFVSFLQNHDQTGNRALGERLTCLAEPRALKAAIALLLLAPQIPLIFMGEEVGSQAPFLFFTDHGPDLAQAVREGRKREFAAFLEAVGRRDLPDPNALASFAACVPERKAAASEEWGDLYRQCLALRHQLVIPRLAGAHSVSAEALGERAAIAQWKMGDGRLLTLACNLGPETAVAAPPREPPRYGQASKDIPPFSTVAWLSE